MPQTRSKRGLSPPGDNTPLQRFKRAKRQLPPPPPRLACPHSNPISATYDPNCTCGSSFRSFPGKAPSNPVSEQYLLAHLGINQTGLIIIIGMAMSAKNAVQRVLQGTNGLQETKALQARVQTLNGDYTRWRVVDRDGMAVDWMERVSEILGEDVEVLAAMDAEVEVLRDMDAEVNAQEVEVDTGERDVGMEPEDWADTEIDSLWDMKTYSGRGWLCYAFIPAVMGMLSNSSLPGAPAVFNTVMKVDITYRAHLLYCAVKIGVGVVSARRQGEWERIIEQRERGRMLTRLEALEKGGGVSTESNELGNVLRNDLRNEFQHEIAALKTAVNTDIENLRKDFKTEVELIQNEVKTDVEELRIDFGEMRTEMDTTTGLIGALAIDQKTTRHLLTQDQLESRRWMQDAVTKIEVSVAARPPPPIPTTTAPSTPQLFLRVRNVPVGLDEDTEDRFFRTYAAGESTFAVARGVLQQFATPFVISVMGYSGSGKSHTILGVEGLIAAVIARLPNPVHIQAYEVLATTRSIADFTYPEQSVPSIVSGIAKARTTAQTPANRTSSRAHLVVWFEGAGAGGPYGIVVDVAGAEEAEHRAVLDPEMKRTSAMIAVENGHMRSLLAELATKGKAGFTARPGPGVCVSEVKRASGLNNEVARFLRCVKGEPVVRVLLCFDGDRMDLLDRALTMVPEFEH